MTLGVAPDTGPANAERRPPKRNVLPFEKGADGRMRMLPKGDRLIRETLRAYHLEGKIIELPLAAE